jgi:hypothetical protein
MKKPDELYVIGEPEAVEAPNVVPIAELPAPRDCTWRDLMRRLQKNTALRAPRNSGNR